jgi:peptidoglycan/LPS O-acetylase OafA/YrhL
VDQRSATRKPERYVTLDGLRGLAAIAVALFHFDPALMPSGYLAVDFFFALSGFVLLRTYAERFAAGLGARRFIALRLVRLYPLHLTGIALGSIFVLQGIARQSTNHLTMGAFLGSLPFNALMLPTPFNSDLFPLNVPAWSLFFENLAKNALVTVLVKLRPVGLVAVVLGSGAALAAVALGWGGGMVHSHLSVGPDWGTFGIGLLRTLFSFSMGMAIARLPAVRRDAGFNARPDAGLGALACAAVLIAVLMIGAPAGWQLERDLAVVMIVAPVVLLLGSRGEPHPALARPATFIGEMSFALYAVHQPIAHGAQMVARKLGVGTGWIAVPFVAVALLVAWGCVVWIDMPLRRWLGRRLNLTPRVKA